MPLDDRAIALCATFTAEAIQPGLSFWAGELGLDTAIRFAGYNQVFQELLDPAGLLARNRSGFNVVLLRLQDWASAGVEDSARRFAEALAASPALAAAPLIVVVCPSPQPFPAALDTLRAAARQLPAVHLLTADEIAALYPVEEIHDPHGDELGHLPYTPLYFAALATAIARKIHAIAQPPYKVIALDCDDTLWAGICGEDGPEGIEIDEPRRALQNFMLERRREGMLLALCSKNNPQDVLDVFAARPDMPLRLEDFAARRIDWNSKAQGLAALAAELELGLDTFILVDDNAKECTEAQAGAPEILALPLPAQPAEIPEFLRHVWAFDRARITSEDRRRAELYAQRAERRRAEKAAGSLEEFLALLELEVAIAPLRPEQIARVAQLTQRTNQMNASCIRRTEAEIRALQAECLTVSVRDRFGDYGLTGAMIFRPQGSALAVDTFLLSCRALGRGVEHRMLARLGEIALERSLDRVEILFLPGKRNQPAEAFFQSVGNPLAAERAVQVRYSPARNPLPALRTSEPRREGAPPLAIDYARIATHLRRPEDVVERIRAAARRDAPRPVVDAPRTPLERDLAEVWAGLLNLPAVGVHENFFELGGHSLLAVQLLSRVRQIYGIELSLEVVYSGEFTVAELAKAGELKEIEQAGGDYRQLLEELAGLSDEEVRALLAEEQDN